MSVKKQTPIDINWKMYLKSGTFRPPLTSIVVGGITRELEIIYGKDRKNDSSK